MHPGCCDYGIVGGCKGTYQFIISVLYRFGMGIARNTGQAQDQRAHHASRSVIAQQPAKHGTADDFGHNN